MAALELLGTNVGVFFRDSGTTNAWMRLTCELTLNFTLTNTVNTELTKCGPFKGIVTPPDAKFSGSGVCNLNPTYTGVNQELSYDLITLKQNTGIKQDFRIQNLAYGSIGLSDQLLIAGSGYFTNTVGTFDNGVVCKFTYDFEVVGPIIVSES